MTGLIFVHGCVGDSQEAITQEGSGEAINQLYMTTMRKYEAIKDEYDSIRKRYSDLVASHSNNISKLELTQVSAESSRWPPPPIQPPTLIYPFKV